MLFRSTNVASVEVQINGVTSTNPTIGTEFDVSNKSIRVIVATQVNWDEQYVIITLS